MANNVPWMYVPNYNYPYFNYYYPYQPQLYAYNTQLLNTNNNLISQHKNTPKFHCKSCDRDYYSEYKYNEHISQHIKCPSENCTFEALENLIEFHYKWQHLTGFNNKCWSQTPEDIAEWIKERKKHTKLKKELQRSAVHYRTGKQAVKTNDNPAISVNDFIKRRKKRSLLYLSKAVKTKISLGTDIATWRKKYTLLERLLAPDIKKESSHLIKCIKLIDKYLL